MGKILTPGEAGVGFGGMVEVKVLLPRSVAAELMTQRSMLESVIANQQAAFAALLMDFEGQIYISAEKMNLGRDATRGLVIAPQGDGALLLSLEVAPSEPLGETNAAADYVDPEAPAEPAEAVEDASPTA